MKGPVRLLVAGFALFAAAGVSYALVTFPVPKSITPIPIFAPSPQAPTTNYTAPLELSPTPVAQGGWGDVIHYIRLGRDQLGPYCSLIVELGANNPQGVNIWTGNWGQGNTVPAPSASIITPQWMLNYMPPTGTPLQLFELVYRPTNDPSDPGWAANPAPAGSFYGAATMCKQFADTMHDFRTRAASANVTTTAMPHLTVYLNVTTGTQAYGEFFVYDLIY